MDSTPSTAQKIIGLVTLVVYVALIWYSTVTPWERKHQANLARAQGRRLAGQLARQSGRAAIADEVAAGQPVGWRLAVTERISKIRDGL